MKIICTTEERNKLVNAMMLAYPCIISNHCPNDVEHCYQCIDKNIEWEITDDNN